MVSYSHVMHDVRNIIEYMKLLVINHKDLAKWDEFFDPTEISSKNIDVIKEQMNHPENLVTLGNISYLFFAPTLCYQLEYPRTKEIRIYWLIGQVCQLGLLLAFAT